MAVGRSVPMLDMLGVSVEDFLRAQATRCGALLPATSPYTALAEMEKYYFSTLCFC